MRSLMMAALILLAASPLHAQDALPQFVFDGHHIGEARPTPEPREQCKGPGGEHPLMVCLRENLDGVHLDAGYNYSSQGNLVGVGALTDSSEFKPLLTALTKRYGEPKARRSGTGHDYVQWRFREGKLHLTRTGDLVVLRFAPSA
ncbi:MAG TPA: hypothetical protein VH539_22370 [Gemmatimonadaceae bacterium]